LPGAHGVPPSSSYPAGKRRAEELAAQLGRGNREMQLSLSLALPFTRN
jgi:hypothetical protein